MSKQLIIVSGAPYSGRTTWINKNLCLDNECVLIDANTYPNLYVKIEKNNSFKLFEDTIEDSRVWCVGQVKEQMELETPPKKIILSLVASRPDRWREFIQLAINNEYECVFKFPTNKSLFYRTKHSTSMEQFKFIESKVSSRYPKDKKEIERKNAKGEYESIWVEANESTLLRQVVIETDSAYAFYLGNKNIFSNKEELLKKINEHYKIAIQGDIKRADKKVKEAEKEAERKVKEEERQAKKLAKEEERQKKAQEKLDKIQSQIQTQLDEQVQTQLEEQVQTQLEEQV